jgi:hypothetical protein
MAYEKRIHAYMGRLVEAAKDWKPKARHWLTCLGCGWTRDVDNNPPVCADGFCIHCGEPANDPFDVARDDHLAALEAKQ